MKQHANIPAVNLPSVGFVEDRPAAKSGNLSLADLERASTFGKRLAMIERVRRVINFSRLPDPNVKVELVVKSGGAPVNVTVPQNRLKEFLETIEADARFALKELGINA